MIAHRIKASMLSGMTINRQWMLAFTVEHIDFHLCPGDEADLAVGNHPFSGGEPLLDHQLGHTVQNRVLDDAPMRVDRVIPKFRHPGTIRDARHLDLTETQCIDKLF